MDIRKRLKDILFHYNATLTSIASDGAMQTRLSRQVNGGSSITYDTISRFLEVFPEVSAEWLMRGKGEMFFNENLSKFSGEENDKEISDKLSYDKLKTAYDKEVSDNIRLKGSLAYLEDYNQRLSAKKISLEQLIESSIHLGQTINVDSLITLE